MTDNDCGKFAIIKAFLLGTVAGAGLALLFAPYSGEEARKKIVEKTDDARKVIKDTTDQVLKKSTELVEEGKKTAESLKGEMSKVVDESKKSLNSIRGDISKFVEESKESVKKTVKEEMASLEKELAAKRKKGTKS